MWTLISVQQYHSSTEKKYHLQSLSFMRNITFIAILLAFVQSLAAQTAVPLQTSIRNGAGTLEMSVLDYGARIQSLSFHGTDVVLGFDRPDDYVTHKQNFGAVVGRYIGRILGGKLTIDGRNYQLSVGSNGDCSHGGTPGFAVKTWTVTSKNDSSVVLRYISPDGENGFPGELTLVVRYTLTADALRIDYHATTTKPTVLNPSNHTFFCLSGSQGEDILNETLWLNADAIAAYDKDKRVTGELQSVAGTPFDFTRPQKIGQRIDEANAQLQVTRGYDHCYRLCTGGSLSEAAARIEDASSGIAMEVFTTEPAMQIYTANGHNGTIKGKGGVLYPRRNAICFETMHFPDSPNKPQWPSTLLRPGETFRSTTVFRFIKM